MNVFVIIMNILSSMVKEHELFRLTQLKYLAFTAFTDINLLHSASDRNHRNTTMVSVLNEMQIKEDCYNVCQRKIKELLSVR